MGHEWISLIWPSYQIAEKYVNFLLSISLLPSAMKKVPLFLKLVVRKLRKEENYSILRGHQGSTSHLLRLVHGFPTC